MDIEEFTKGLISENAVFALALGLCPVLAITTRVENALGMSLAVLFVITFSNLIVSIIKDYVPEKVRIPSFIVIIATLVTVVDLTMHGFAIGLYRNLGIFLPLIVVNCMILGRAEAFASQNSITNSILDALGMGLGFAFAIISVSAIRELFGRGKIVVFGYEIIPTIFSKPVVEMVLPTGAFLTIGVLLGLLRWTEVMEHGEHH